MPEKVYKRYRPRNQFMLARQHLTSVIEGPKNARAKSGIASQVCESTLRSNAWLTGKGILENILYALIIFLIYPFLLLRVRTNCRSGARERIHSDLIFVTSRV